MREGSRISLLTLEISFVSGGVGSGFGSVAVTVRRHHDFWRGAPSRQESLLESRPSERSEHGSRVQRSLFLVSLLIFTVVSSLCQCSSHVWTATYFVFLSCGKFRSSFSFVTIRPRLEIEPTFPHCRVAVFLLVMLILPWRSSSSVAALCACSRALFCDAQCCCNVQST